MVVIVMTIMMMMMIIKYPTCIHNCDYRIAAKIYSLETWFVPENQL
jgi:hypothetical protein